jgi:hypothetical protein
MDFVAKRRTLKITIDGTAHVVRFPLLGELREYRLKLKEDNSDGEVALSNFLASLGLPHEAQGLLEIADLNEVVTLLTDQKKT